MDPPLSKTKKVNPDEEEKDKGEDKIGGKVESELEFDQPNEAQNSGTNQPGGLEDSIFRQSPFATNMEDQSTDWESVDSYGHDLYIALEKSLTLLEESSQMIKTEQVTKEEIFDILQRKDAVKILEGMQKNNYL
jgi:hypothetical protein